MAARPLGHISRITRRPWLSGCTRRRDPAEELAQLHYFSFKKLRPEGDVEFVIAVKEFASRNTVQMRFYAQADKEINQRTAPFRAFGSGDSLLAALTECVRAIRQYPYEPE